VVLSLLSPVTSVVIRSLLSKLVPKVIRITIVKLVNRHLSYFIFRYGSHNHIILFSSRD
jgi:hypothetical protein